MTRYLIIRFLTALLSQRHPDFKSDRQKVDGLLSDLVTYPGFARSNYQPSFQLSASALGLLHSYQAYYDQQASLWVRELVKAAYFKHSQSIKKNILLYLKASAAGLLTQEDYKQITQQINLAAHVEKGSLNETGLLQSLRIYSDKRFYRPSESGAALISSAVSSFSARFLNGPDCVTALTIFLESMQESPEMQWESSITKQFSDCMAQSITRQLNDDGSSLSPMRAVFLYKYLLEFDEDTWTLPIMDQLGRANELKFKELFFRLLEVKYIADAIGPSSNRPVKPALLRFIAKTINTFQSRLLEDFSAVKHVLIFLLRIDASQLMGEKTHFIEFCKALEVRDENYDLKHLSQLSFDLLKRLHYRLQRLGLSQPSFTKRWLLALMAASNRISLQDVLTCSRFMMTDPSDFPQALQNPNLFKTLNDELLRLNPETVKVSVSTLVELCRIMQIMLATPETALNGKYTHSQLHLINGHAVALVG